MVRKWLHSEGYEATFLDYHEHDGIVGGEAWEERLYTELRRCRALIALVSPNWVTSPWCVAEVNYAHALRKSIIPLQIAALETRCTHATCLLCYAASKLSTGGEKRKGTCASARRSSVPA